LSAARHLNRRAVFLIGRDTRNQLTSALPDTMISASYAPFSAIFPRAAAIVHQGGIGTTGQALRAGKPMLIMPHAFDQPDNADRIKRLGVGLTVPRAKYSTKTAVKTLHRLLNDPSFSEKAAQMGRRVQVED
jgi:rhamnosyltransferase subunit B